MKCSEHKKSFNIKVGEELKRRRNQLGISQYELSERTGIKRNSIAQYELGNSAIPLDKFYILCKVLDKSPSDLLNSAFVANEKIKND